MSQLNFLEWVDANLLWALLLALLALMLIGWGIYSLSNKSRMSSNSWRIRSRSSHNDTELMDLESHWNSRRDYSAVYDKKPSGNWFEDERRLCNEFLEKLANPPKHDIYPADEKQYLEIVKESDTKPFSIWLWTLVVVLLFAEGLSMAYLVADILTPGGSQQDTNYLAVAILVLIVVLTVGVPKFVAYFQTHQFYAYNLYAEAPNANLSLEGHELDLTASPTPDKTGNASDPRLAGSLRMRRRAGKTVRGILNSAIRSAKPPSRYHWAVYFFIPYLVLASVGIYLTRDKIIDQLQKGDAALIREERDAARAARGDSASDRTQSASGKAGDAEGVSDLSQEAREAKADAQRRGVLIFIFLFVGIQIIVFLLSVGKGFCSAKGSDCYDKIEKFKKRHGDVTKEEYESSVNDRMRQHRMEVTAFAQRTLAAWQLGLNTSVTDKNVVKNVDANTLRDIYKLISKADERTFLTYAESKEGKAYLSDPTLKILQKRAADSSSPGLSTEASDDADGGDRLQGDGNEGMSSTARNEHALATGGNVIVNKSAVEYLEEGEPVNTLPKTCSLTQLKERVADAEIAPTCRVRFAGDGEYLPYATFVRMGRRFRGS